MTSPPEKEHLRTLLARLERVSVDSHWARRAMGVRGSLVKAIEKLDAGQPVDPADVDAVASACYHILEKAAREIPDSN